MTMWLMRAGRAGEREGMALRHQVAVGGWDELPDITPCTSRIELEALLRSTYPEQKPRTLQSWHGQLWSLRNTVQVGDLAVLPLKTRPNIALGVVAGPYEYRRDLPGGPLHTRPVDWVTTVPRRAFDVDILLSFGALMSICRIERNDAEQRVRTLLCAEPAVRDALAAPATARPAASPAPASPATPLILAPDLEERSFVLIRDRIAQRFKGHGFAALVGHLLAAQGFRPRVSPPGPDGGVDIMAGSGPLGFDAPRLVVQVKSQHTRLDVRVLRELAGVMNRFGADQGLLVGWGGFNAAVRAEAAADYFRIRLWDAADVVTAVKEHYRSLPHGVRAEIPLKQVWTLDGQDASVAA